ncbi:MAG: 4Fe-4S dicluster domain-containing protein [Thermoleophilia bacterium]
MAIRVSSTIADGASVIREIERRSGERVSACYQCGRCTSTCTGAFAFDYPPHRIMRLLQLGQVEEVLNSRTAQLCFDCMTCSSRCPMTIDVAYVIETAKMIADERGIEGEEEGVRLFRLAFLKNVRRHGRLHEARLMAWINLRSGKIFNDISLVPKTLRKKKVHIVPPRIKNRREIHRIFREVNAKLRDE